jgi:hypothetical protein
MIRKQQKKNCQVQTTVRGFNFVRNPGIVRRPMGVGDRLLRQILKPQYTINGHRLSARTMSIVD